MWEWDIRVIDIQEGEEEDYLPICLGGRGAAPPEHCGGPTGYRLMLKRQGEGAAMSYTVLVEAGIQMFAAACPAEPPRLGRYPVSLGRRLSKHQPQACGIGRIATGTVLRRGI